ncbi:MAG: ABC-F type ribosomal protection protein [Clostridia bacterium]|nr:ABC-F type ribosomal protection protein [Clostridia bacterium]
MSLIQISNLSFAYEGSYETIFENVSFQIDTNWKLGFTGRNGRGKTTFLNLLLGKYEYQGSITASVDFSYFPYEIPDPTATALDVAYQIEPTLLEWRLLRELATLEFSPEALDRPYHTLSGGEQAKLQLAVLFLRENNFLLIDEPTNHLDLAGRELVSRYLNRKKGFILVSHDQAFLDGCVDHILSINRANIEVQRGNFSSWWQNKTQQDALEITQNERLRKEIRRLRDTAREKADWSDRVEATKIGSGPCDRGAIGHKAAKMMARSKAIEKRQLDAIEEKSKLLKNIEVNTPIKIFEAPFYTRRYAELMDVTISYGEREICRNIRLRIEAGDRIALRGANGSGKSSLIKLLCGEDIPHTGEVRVASGLRISYMSQDTGHLRGIPADIAREAGIDESLFYAMLYQLGVNKSQLEKDVRQLSAGQKKKILLAKSICESDTHLRVWDEPLNYIDIISRMQIRELLLTHKPTILFVEHDRAFCDAVATKTIQL